MDSDAAYAIGRGVLTDEERTVLALMRQSINPAISNGQSSFGEHYFHMMMSITQDSLGERFYTFEPKWWEHVDERYVTNLGSVPYSEKLHEVVESLVRKHYLARDPENPIMISEDGELRLF